MIDPKDVGPASSPILIGPLTGDEWASLALGDDDRNPLPPCCGNLSDARDALFRVMRAGGDPAIYWRTVAEVWPDIESHVGTGEIAASPVLAKLHAAYVAGRAPVERSREAMARILARDPKHVRMFLDTLHAGESPWGLTTREGQVGAVARIGGAFIATVLDPDERNAFAGELAGLVGWDAVQMGVLIDVLRERQQLPYDPTHPDHRIS